MTYIILISLVLGIISGYSILPHIFITNIDKISTFALCFFILSVGIDIGRNKEIFIDLKKQGFKILLIPFSTVIGTLIGGVICSFIFNMSLSLGLSISSGFGWYSLSGILLAKLIGPEIGAISFLSNVFRELIAVLTISLIAKKLNYFSSISVAGATAMDSTLPIISEATNEKTVLISFISGAVLTILVPILVPLLLRL